MRITLKQLDVFAAVAREGSVTRAAGWLNLTQSATSMALSDLETQLGARLFDRVGRRLQLNELGARLLPLAQETVARASEIEDIASSDQPGVGRLRISASLSIGSYLMPQLIGDYLGTHPEAEISLNVGNTRQVIEAVRQFSCDIGFIEGSCHEPDIEMLPWREDELVIYAGSQHALARQRGVSAEDLAQAHWILREPGSGTREVFDNAIAGTLPSLKIRLELSHTEAIRRAVEAGIGIGCASRLTLEESLAEGRVRILPTPYLNLRRSLFVLRHRSKYQTRGMQHFLAACGLASD
ncbi:MAG: LysR family transcriptional regulator [Perlucidibaca sp.]